MKIQDLSNLSDFFFADGEGEEVSEYVSPKIEVVACDAVVQGRGLIATESIKAGECLFVTPPTVVADKMKIREMAQSSSASLEDVAMEVMARAMLDCIQRRDFGKSNSFLALAGSSKVVKDQAIPTMDRLFGRESDGFSFCHTADPDSVSDKDIREIISHNAFGPDFITYETIQRVWRGVDGEYLPHHILGVYPLAAMVNHACTPNVVRVFVGESMVVHASNSISKGEEIVFSYIPVTQPFADRRRALKRQHQFVCRCDRCKLESKHLKSDLLPSSMKRAFESVSSINAALLEPSSRNIPPSEVTSLFSNFEDTIFSSEQFPNHMKRYLRVSHTNMHMNFLNTVLSVDSPSLETKEVALNTASQLHFALCVSDMANTAHLSILHLCYDLSNEIHKTSPDKSKSIVRVRFWTEQLKKAHQIRYGALGSDLEAVRKLLVHTRTVLRKRHGFVQSEYKFI